MLKKKTKDSFQKSKIFFSIFLLIFVGFLGFSNFKIIQKRETLKKENQLLSEKLSFLKKEKEKLERAILESKRESYWEEKIREAGYLKKGENLVVILPPSSFEKKKIVEEEKRSESFLEKIKKFFQEIKEKIE